MRSVNQAHVFAAGCSVPLPPCGAGRGGAHTGRGASSASHKRVILKQPRDVCSLK